MKCLYHLQGNLVVITDDPVHGDAAFQHELQHLRRLHRTILRMKPDHHIGIVGTASLLKRLHIPLMAFLSLTVISLKNPQDPAVP